MVHPLFTSFQKNPAERNDCRLPLIENFWRVPSSAHETDNEKQPTQMTEKAEKIYIQKI